ncbi:MAG: cytochrome ubiquinol oxidase subunit I [Desulfobacteraceae bacterium]|nr:MAG: cytochrome ubiquinol oxidase subunit I [Desulfobacteraceae bacterium]
MDAVLLSRWQFGITTAFHILFPTLTIGLAIYLAVIETLWLWKKKEIYYRLYRFWVKIFAIHFSVGVVTGITLEFEFGTNFSRFSQAVANVFAPLLAFEGMTAFFLEAGFLGIMLFGWKRVPPLVHYLSTCLVAVGASFSAFWIMAANAWMQTPAGYEIANGRFMVTSYWEAIFNPAFPTHLGHMLLASYTTSAFAVSGISAYYLLKGKNIVFYRRSLALALWMALLTAPLQVLMGDLKGLNVARNQPAKLAAMEAHWETNTEGGAPFVLFAVPDPESERNRMEITVPNALSLLITHSWEGKVQGLKDFPKTDRASVMITFWTFRIMVAIGFVFLLTGIWAAVLWRKRAIFTSRPFLKALIVIQPLGFVATVLGWITAEAGRQPWVVYGLIRTADGASPIPAGNVVWSMSLFVVLFAIIGSSYFYYTLKTLRRGPDLTSPIPPVQRPSGMLSLQDDENRKEVLS